MFSLIILNWQRPMNVIEIINNMHTFKNIDEIIISNGNKRTSINMTQLPERNIKIFNDYEENDTYGLDLRFVNGLRANNDNIIIIDDDVKIDESELNKVIDVYNADKNRIVGIFGRIITDGKYTFKDIYGNVDIVLTRLVICQKKLCNLFFLCKPIVEPIYKTGVPYGNGEDIFLSFITSIYFKNSNYCVEDVITTTLNEGKCAISKKPNHQNYRNMLWKYLISHKNKFETLINYVKL